ncbi:MAG: 4'-phosphopantetheinyl transferase superfamily protein [Opitutaceae bacterium]|nr:4'-phosphopantetheinyl transferase superfamily protein [Opitutaceae bacterium]
MLDDCLNNWPGAPDEIVLPRGKIHIWAVSLDSGEECLAQCRGLLSESEISRAQRFHFDADQRRFIIARGTLRQLLGRYLKCAADTIVFQTNEYGKPRLGGNDGLPLHFNISHSGEMAVMAFSCERELGIDIEWIREEINCLDLSERFFSKTEAVVLKSLPEKELSKCFFETWTRKEAFIKALGKGLSIPLDQFDVSVGVEVPPALLEVRVDEVHSKEWFISKVILNNSFSGAVVAEGGPVEIQQFRI